MRSTGTTDEGEGTVLEKSGAETDEPKQHETPEESARAALRELQEGIASQGNEDAAHEDTGADDAGVGEAPKVVREAEAAQKPEAPEEIDPLDLEPPARLSPKERAIFNKLPKAFRPSVARMFKEHQASEVKRANEYANATRESRHVLEAVRPYYNANPELAESGITEGAFVAALVGAHQKLTNPKTAKQTIAKIAADSGHKIKFVNDDGEEIKEGGSQGSLSDISQHPNFIALQNQFHQLQSLVHGERASAAASPIVSEFEAVRCQKDSAGRFLYPEMHENSFWEQARPLISQLTGQGIPPGEALKRAHYSLTGRIPSTPANRPHPQNQNIQNRAVTAGISVRGRTAPPGNQIPNGIDVSKHETPEQSARIALEELRRGMI